MGYEGLEVSGSHVDLGWKRVVVRIVGDRLAQGSGGMAAMSGIQLARRQRVHREGRLRRPIRRSWCMSNKCNCPTRTRRFGHVQPSPGKADSAAETVTSGAFGASSARGSAAGICTLSPSAAADVSCGDTLTTLTSDARGKWCPAGKPSFRAVTHLKGWFRPLSL